MVLLITSLAIFVHHIKVAGKQSNPRLMGKHSLGVEWIVYLAPKLQFLGVAARLQPHFALGLTGWNSPHEPGAALQTVLESQS